MLWKYKARRIAREVVEYIFDLTKGRTDFSDLEAAEAVGTICTLHGLTLRQISQEVMPLLLPELERLRRRKFREAAEEPIVLR